MGGEQDMRKMGGLRKYMPWTFWTFTISVLAIAGVPGLAGFFFQDEIFLQAFFNEHGSARLLLLGLVTPRVTPFFMFPPLLLVFFCECRAPPHTPEHLPQ